MWYRMVLWRHILKKFSAFDLAAEFSKVLKTLIDHQKCKLAVAAKSARLKCFSSFLLNEKFCGLSGLSGLSGLVPNYVCNNINGLLKPLILIQTIRMNPDPGH